MQRTQQVFLLCLCALVAGVAFAPSQANALDLQIPIQLDFSYRSDTEKDQTDGAQETKSTAARFGVQLPFIFKFHPKFGVGPSFRFNYGSGSSQIGSSPETSSSAYFIGFGVMLRSDVHEMFAIQAAGYYDIGKYSKSTSGTTTTPDIDVSGLEVRLDLLGRAKVGQYKTWFEIGPYFAYRNLTGERTVSNVVLKSDYSGFDIGLAIQGTFEFGI